MQLRILFFLLVLAGLKPLNSHAQEPAPEEGVIIYALADQYSQKPDADKVSPAIIPGVERQFFCITTKTLYIEVAASQAGQCESYLNSRGIACLLKKNCSLDQVEEHCSTVVKEN